MAFKLSARSRGRLKGVHPELVRVVKRAITLTTVDFSVLEGLRSLARQQELVAAGASRTLNSRHLTGHAVDLGAWVALETGGGEVRWDWPLYHRIADAMLTAAVEEGVRIEWGGSWARFADGPHFQLPWAEYPT